MLTGRACARHQHKQKCQLWDAQPDISTWHVRVCKCCCVLLRAQDLKFVGMMQYDGDLLLPANYLVPPPEIHKTSGEFLVHNGISTFACSETQKFGHVTFFWNGNRSGYFDSKLETYLEVGAVAAAWPRV